jgi:uncharacterized integral membrane protein (TIGR00697 family)
MGNLIYQKFVSVSFLFLTPLELSVGAILYPLTFLITDLITEFYGKLKANFCIRMAIWMNILVALAIAGVDYLETAPWSIIDAETFHKVFGLYTVAFIGSVIACYIAQRIDVSIYVWIRKMTGERWLWLRNNGSTAISLMIDTGIVICFMALFGVLPVERAGTLIANSYLFKLFFMFCTTPLFYLGYWAIRRVFDTSTFPKTSQEDPISIEVT